MVDNIQRFIHVIANERARTGEVLDKCRGCPDAVIIAGENVEKGEILFCLRHWDFPVKRMRVIHIPSKTRYVFTEKFWCEVV